MEDKLKQKWILDKYNNNFNKLLNNSLLIPLEDEEFEGGIDSDEYDDYYFHNLSAINRPDNYNHIYSLSDIKYKNFNEYMENGDIPNEIYEYLMNFCEVSDIDIKDYQNYEMDDYISLSEVYSWNQWNHNQ